MFEHIWIEETCSWIIAPKDRIPSSGDLKSAELYFVWGFLMDLRFIEKLVGHAIPIAPAIMRGHHRETFVKDGTRGFRLVPDENGVVMGVVLIGPTREEITALDRFEQVPAVMVKKKIEVSIGDMVREANIYLKA